MASTAAECSRILICVSFMVDQIEQILTSCGEDVNFSGNNRSSHKDKSGNNRWKGKQEKSGKNRLPASSNILSSEQSKLSSGHIDMEQLMMSVNSPSTEDVGQEYQNEELGNKVECDGKCFKKEGNSEDQIHSKRFKTKQCPVCSEEFTFKVIIL